MIYLGGLKKVKDTIIKGLRAFFTNNTNYRHLLPEQINANAFIGINIFDTHPQTLRTFPMIVLSGSNGRMVSGGISNDFASEIYNNAGYLEGYLYGGMYEFAIDVEIGTKTTLEREVLMDITTSALRWSLRRRMEYHGIIIKAVSYGGENKIPYDSDFIYTSTLNAQVYSEWWEYYKLLPVTDVEVKQTLIKKQQQEESKKSWYIPYETEIDLERGNNEVNNHIYNNVKA